MERDVIVKESLPFPYAHYAETFIGFHERLGSEITFCSCQKTAIENHLEMCRISGEANRRREQILWHVNPYAQYPRALLKAALRFTDSPSRALLQFIRFRDGLCHKCNQRIPYGNYGFSDRPSSYFICHFRPYFNQMSYEIGLHPSGVLVLPEKCPDDVKALTEKERARHVEERTRAAFCFPPVGINRNQESKLLLLVREIFPECVVIQHCRPEWLDGLEFDIFVEHHKLAIEFQGFQHSQAVEHLGGEKAFRKIQRRDKRKAALCRAHGVKLITVDEGAALTDSAIRTRLRTALPSLHYAPPRKIERPPFVFYVPVEGQKFRWTYHDDKNELSVSGKVGAAEVYLAGSDFDLIVFAKQERVTGIELSIRKIAGSASIKSAVSDSEVQTVDCRPYPRPMLEFFKVWSMFNPRISILESKE